MLIEVMVGAVVLAIATTALLNGIDGAQGTGARNKARSTAAALAEQDQERLRALPVKSLANYGTTTRPVTVAKVNYTVKSTVTWATDTGGPISCSNASKSAANLRILSEVTSRATKGTVDLVSLVTPPPGTFSTGQGRAIVKVTDRGDQPLAGASVSLTGAASLAGTTNSLGCVVFQFAPVGNYTATVSGLNLVDTQGNAAPTELFTVNQSQSTLADFQMDRKAEIDAQFDTSVNANVVTANVASQWLTVTSPYLTTGLKTFEAAPAGAPSTMVKAINLFPFASGYGAYAGKCTANDPSKSPTSNASYLKTYTPGQGQVLTTGTTPGTTRIRMPSINVRVVTSNSTTGTGPGGFNNATIFVYPADGACTGMNPAPTFPTQVSATRNYGGTNYVGAIPNPGFPYGQYKVCAQRVVSNVTYHGHADLQPFDIGSTAHPNETVSNTNPNGNNPNWNVAGTSTYPPSIRIYINSTVNGPGRGACHA